MTLSIAVQLVSGQVDYLVKVGTPIFGIFLAAADRKFHKLLTACHALILCGRMSLVCGQMSPLTTTPTHQLAIKAPRSVSPCEKGYQTVLADKRVTVRELSLHVGIREVSICRILK